VSQSRRQPPVERFDIGLLGHSCDLAVPEFDQDGGLDLKCATWVANKPENSDYPQFKFPTDPVDGHKLQTAPWKFPAGAGTSDIAKYAGVLDGHLQGRDFVACDRLTIADFQLASMATYWRQCHLPLGDYPNIVRWLDGLMRIPAWAEPWPGRSGL